MGSIFSIADFFDMLRRRWLVALGVFILGTGLALLFAASQQHLYTSSEVLQIQSATISPGLAPSTAQGSSARRLQLIEQQVMSRGTILELIDQLGLFADQPGMTDAQQVLTIRQAVRVSGTAAAREGFSDDGSVSLLRISAEWPTAIGAQQLAHEISRRTVSLSVSTRLDQARETLDFFTLQEDALNGQVGALEREIAQFRARNDTALPGSAQTAQNELATLNDQILTIDRQLITLQRQIAAPAQSRVERRKRDEVQAQLDSLSEERALVAQKADALRQSLTGTPGTQQQLDEYARQLDELHREARAAAARRKEAETAYQLETQRQTERLTVLEPAALAEYPFTRSRKTLALLGAAAALLAGIGAAFLVDLRHPVIRSAAQMEHALGLRPVVSIPQMQPANPPRQGRRARLAGLFRRR